MHPDRLPCGCHKSGFYACPDHRRDTASDPLALVSVALFVGMIAIWAAVFSG